MTTITVEAIYQTSPDVVWEELRHIDRHVHWMHDALAIRFASNQHDGLGTTFECDTKLGPFRTTDVMEITEWIENTSMGVAHRGLITGEGRFTLTPAARATRVTWRETLHFPWWLAGPVGSTIAAPVLRALWRRNLDQLGRQLVR